MAINYEKLAKTSRALIKAAGKEITLVKRQKGITDSDKPWIVALEYETTISIPAVQVLPDSVRVFGLAALGNASTFEELIPKFERVYIVFQGETDLSQFVSVRDDGITFQIEATQALKPAQKTLLGYIGVSR